MAEGKPFCISKWAVLEAWRRVRANRGAAGVDDVSVAEFEKKLKNNLYRIWNRMSSGSYVPLAVRRVMIPKPDGRERPLGIPTVGDRVAQMVVKMHLEPIVEPLFHPSSYGYRPGKSALDAVATCRQRCWRYDWVVDLDIRPSSSRTSAALRWPMPMAAMTRSSSTRTFHAPAAGRMAQAIGYTPNQWAELTLFTTDPAVPIHNNLAEQRMKCIALLRKNALFAGSPRGGETAAINPQAYLTQLLANLPDTPISQLDQWLPDQWQKIHATPSNAAASAVE
jgi:hypothetical protein